MNEMTVGFVGLGKLGLPCAEVMAEHYKVLGYDIRPRKSESVTITDTLEETITNSDIIFVAIETPHDPLYDGSRPSCHLEPKDFNYDHVKGALKEINKLTTPEQIVVLISTVLPGTIRRELNLYISTPKFVYNPYLIAMGSVKWDMVNPEMVIIGTEDGAETDEAATLVEFYKPIMKNDPRYVLGTWDEAESIKIFYNTMISAKIGLVNMIQDVAMKNKHIDVDVVTKALAESNMRITSKKYMTAGMGDSGPCHPRDNIALRWLAKDLDLGYDLFEAIMGARERQAYNMAQFLYSLAAPNKQTIYIHGKAYKPDVDILDGSYSLLIGHYLTKMGYAPTYIDPLTGDDPPTSAVYGVILLAHNRSITYDYTGNVGTQDLYCHIADGSTVVDPWRTFNAGDKSNQIKVIYYGNLNR